MNTRTDCEVLIVGAGPVGLMLGNLLGKRGIKTLVVEKRTELPVQSMAIGITPPSLDILRTVGLDTAFERAGVTVRQAGVWESRAPIGRLAFQGLPTEYSYILSIPQTRTIELLRENLRQFSSVTLSHGVEFNELQQDNEGVTVRLRELDSGIEMEVRARMLVACDGHRSAVRRAVGIEVREKVYPQRWVMGDFIDGTDLGDAAHLFFASEASVESFPLPGGRRRWIVLTPHGAPADPAGYLISEVRRLTGYDPGELMRESVSCFGAKRMLAKRYGTGRVWLCGDAAHVMSSIGGQGMNTGFADAELAASSLAGALAEPATLPQRLAVYDAARRRAYNVAAGRAERGMYLGTARGWLASQARKVIIRDLLFSRWLAARLAPYFAMLTIPPNPMTGERA